MSKQKFPRGATVRVAKVLRQSMSHFPSDFEAVVEYTYKQRYGGNVRQGKQYSLIMLNSKGKPVNSIAWYTEDQLTLVDTDTVEGKRIIEQWRFKE